MKKLKRLFADPVRSLLLCLILMCGFIHQLQAQKELEVTTRWIEFSDAPNSLYHYLADEAYGLLKQRSKKISALHSLQDWQQRQKWLRKTLMDAVGPFPEKTALNANIIRPVTTDKYKIEHIVFQSQPGFYVTSSLFMPANLSEGTKAPAIIYCSGHSNDGYRNPAYQQAILSLVEKGFVVFAFDPVGQGERYEYYDPIAKKAIIGARDEEHSYAGAQPFISGSSLARYMIWDGIRAIDYLLTRKEVDPARIGITGRSGGGTQSAYIAAFDDRIKAVAPENYITNFTRLIQSSGPQDAEQEFYNGLKRGLDMADLLSVRAPIPALVISTTRDLTFSIQGALETASEVSQIYKAYGKKDVFRKVIDDAPHASTKKGREAMYAFFQKYLNNPGDSTDKELKMLSAEQLQVTNTGQVATSYNSETVFSLNRKTTEALESKLEASREKQINFSSIINSAKELSGYRSPLKDVAVFMGRFQQEGYAIEKYYVKGEGDYVIPYLLMKPDQPNHKSLLYLNPSGKAVESAPGGEMEWFVKKGFTVLAPDLVGMGEMGPGVFRGDSYIKGVSYNVWLLSMLIGRSILGVRTGDVIKLVKLLKENKDISEVYGLAIKELSPVLLHAAAFDTAISRVALIEPLSSYRSIVMSRFYNPVYIHSAVPGALTRYDLPDLAASLAPRKLLLVGTKDATEDQSDTSGIEKDLSIIRSAYDKVGAGRQLINVGMKKKEGMNELYGEWIK